MELYARPKQDALKTLNSTEGGLTQEEAERRLAAFGKNELKEGRRRSIPALFFAQFKDLMTLILVAAAVLSGVLAYVTGDRSELTDTAILLFIIVLNAAVGVVLHGDGKSGARGEGAFASRRPSRAGRRR